MKIVSLFVLVWVALLSAVAVSTAMESRALRDWTPALNLLVWPALFVFAMLAVLALVFDALRTAFGAGSSVQSEGLNLLKILGAVLLAALIAALSYCVSAFLI